MKAIGILGAVVLALMLVLCGCTQNQANDNAEFLEWMGADSDYQARTNDKLVNEINSYAWYNLEVAAGEAENYVETISKPKCDSFTLSGTYISIKSEYSAYLSDVSLSYSYMKSAGREMLYGQVSVE